MTTIGGNPTESFLDPDKVIKTKELNDIHFVEKSAQTCLHEWLPHAMIDSVSATQSVVKNSFIE
jgi:hypothetical protein